MTGTTKEQDAVLHRVFGNLTRRDAKQNLRVIVTDADIKIAVRVDPCNCAIAKACHRMFNSTAAVIFHTIAYVDLIDDKSKRWLERFVVSRSAKRAIELFDKTGKADPAGFILRAPSPCNTTEALRKKNKVYEEAKKANGITRPHRKSIIRSPKITENEGSIWEIRNGSGMVQGIRKT
jgi:hypothetical protein